MLTEKEKDFAKRVVARLGPFFNFRGELWSSDRKSRIDYLLQLKTNSSILFGIEFKHCEKKTGEALAEHIQQTIRYSKSEYRVDGSVSRVPFFMCPPMSYNLLICPSQKIIHKGVEYFSDRHDRNHDHHTMNGFLGAFGIGEIRTQAILGKQYLFFKHSNRTIWSEKNGLNEKNYNILIEQIKSE